ncbi:hypothetical protein CHL76_15275 [Marinococcus halophilus]|uniref:Anti-sigma-W factor RsiW n=1 Tax=Marinococcus halophilus TaxID=1371 RepID=A0A510YAX7_MARHA|nr:anti-sigma factor [Marinococcus halophilus]OZT78938.1 hypothetical protein CHL76_15275 [Marinococcus halophilus]GEK60303.1 hypothetical protein MHA01_32080 [Marinococcus halophilus]
MALKEQEEKYIQRYIDGDMDEHEKEEFRSYIKENPECAHRLQELKRTVTMVQGTSHVWAPETFTDSIMKELPKKRKRTAWKSWSRQHPVLVAVSMFIVLMASSVLFAWNDQSGAEMTVTGDQANVNIDYDNNAVIIPENEIVQGDLTVRNGEVDVHGKVNGDLTVINGDPYMASAGSVSGDIEEVDQVLEWIWYHTKRISQEAWHMDDEKEAA